MRKRILIIEDDPEVRRLMSLNLAARGYEVREAGSGERGLEILRQIPVDLVLLNLTLPGISGWEVLRELRGDPSLKHIPVIISSLREEEGRALREGASAFLPKPFDIRALIAKVEEVLKGVREG